MPPSALRAALLLAALTTAAALYSGCRRHGDDQPLPVPREHPREQATSSLNTGSLAPITGDSETDRMIRNAQEVVRRRPREARGYITLAQAFVQKAREAEDPSYYAQANDAVRRGLEVEPRNVEIEQLRGLLLLQDHRFREARDVAHGLEARSLETHGTVSADTFAILSDALLELGDYDGSVRAAQRMVDIRPSSQAYVRAAWLRWLNGDGEGAVDGMRLAIDAMPRNPEVRAWITTQLGVIFWNAGNLDEAQRYFDSAILEYEPFSMAHAGRARVALARGDAATAAREATLAVRANPSAENEWLAGDACAAAGQRAEADAHYESLERIGARVDPRTLSLYYSTTNRRPEQALDLARREHENRQDIVTDDALAWALYRSNQLPAAAEAIARARRLGTRDARILFHEGMIKNAQGDREGATIALRAALAANPYWRADEAGEARRVLHSLGVEVPVAAVSNDAASNSPSGNVPRN